MPFAKVGVQKWKENVPISKIGLQAIKDLIDWYFYLGRVRVAEMGSDSF